MTPTELVVFLPAVGADAGMWRREAAALAGRYATLSLDLARPAGPAMIAAWADDVAQAIERAGFARAHVVGLSLGGVVALELFRRHRGKVRSLALCNTFAHHPEGEARATWVEGKVAELGVPGFSRLTMPDLFAKATPREVVERAIAVESEKEPAAYAAAFGQLLRSDLREVAAAIDVPLLLVGGAEDPVTPTSLLRPIAAAAPAARLVELPGASHFSNLDQPEAFLAALRGFLRTAGGGVDDRLSAPSEADLPLPPGTAADRLLRLLAARGVEAFFSNSGTDFTPLIEALAGMDEAPLRIVAAPHENTAVAMAHGHALVSRRAQAVMAHVNVGTANMGLGLVNARRAHVPLLLLAGRTPWFEEGMAGVRTNFVQWGQEAFDQGAMFREFTKWDYELRRPHGLHTVLDRALAIAESEPKGPVYLTLPKEPLCEPVSEPAVPAEPRQRAARPSSPDDASLDAAASWLRAARRPLVVTADLGRHAGAPEALVRLAERAGAGVVEHGKRNFFNFPTEHPHHLGFDPTAEVREADLVVAVECPVPWIPAFARLPRPPRVISLGVDPLFQDLPLRGFPADLALAGEPAETLRRLAARLPAADAARTAALASRHEAAFAPARAAAAADASRPRITKAHLSWALGRAVDDDVVICNEYDLDPLLVPRRCPGSWLENSVASGLGWSLGAALGVKLAAPERTVVATLGDGSYLFNTPLSAHFVAAAEKLPILIVVFDDAAWSTIKRSTKGSHPGGAAATRDRFALCDFPVQLDLAKVAEASGGIGLRVERPSELEGAIAEVLRLVRSGDRHVLLDVLCERDG